MRDSVLWFAIIVAFSVLVYPLWGNSWAGLLYGNLSQIAGLIIASRSFNKFQYVCNRKDPLRAALGLMTLGMMIWLLAQIMEIYCELVLKLIAYGTVSDAIWIIGYFPIIRGLHLILTTTLSKPDEGIFRQEKKILILLIAFYALLFYFLILPQMEENQTLPEKILDFSYPTLDFVLVGLSAILLKRTRPGKKYFRLAFLLTAGFTLTLIGDSVLSIVKDFNSFLYNSVDIFYFISYFLMAMGADLELRARGDFIPEYSVRSR